MPDRYNALHPAAASRGRPVDPPIPHPSWRMATNGREPERRDRIDNAEDFWKRLGM